MGLGITTSGACLPGVFWVCSFLFVTIWVAPGNRARELRTRGSTVLTQDSQGSQMVGPFRRSKDHQVSRIGLLPLLRDEYAKYPAVYRTQDSKAFRDRV